MFVCLRILSCTDVEQDQQAGVSFEGTHIKELLRTCHQYPHANTGHTPVISRSGNSDAQQDFC